MEHRYEMGSAQSLKFRCPYSGLRGSGSHQHWAAVPCHTPPAVDGPVIAYDGRVEQCHAQGNAWLQRLGDRNEPHRPNRLPHQPRGARSRILWMTPRRVLLHSAPRGRQMDLPNPGGLTGSSARSGQRRGLPRDRRYGLSAILARIRGWVSQADPVPPQPGQEEGRHDRR